MPPTQSVESCSVKSNGSCSKSDTELGRKDKIVHLAVSVRLSLVSVINLPTPPPKRRLKSRRWSSTDEEQGKLLNFTQPRERQDFNEGLNELNLSLEDIVLRDFSVYGTVKVRNLAYRKAITVRYTIDGWSTYRDVVGQYIEGSHTGFTDTFVFEISLPTVLIKDCKLEFAICYRVLGAEYWDNNSGDNYQMMCYGRCPSLTPWLTVACHSHWLSKMWEYIAYYVLFVLEKIRSLNPVVLMDTLRVVKKLLESYDN